MTTNEIRNKQLNEELYDEMENYTDSDEDVSIIVKRMNRQERKRRKTSREYPDTLRVNAIRHAIEYADGLRMRQRRVNEYLRDEIIMAMAE